MEIVINVDSEKFNEIIQKELEAFSKDELHELIRKGIINCLSNEDTLKNLFTRKSQGYYDTSYQANEILKEAVKTVNFDEMFKPLQDKIIDYVKNNHEKIIKEFVLKKFETGLCMSLDNNDSFRNAVRQVVWDMQN